MQLKAEQLAAHLARGPRPVYAVHGDEPLLAQEAADSIRAAARAAGHSERQVFTASGAHFDWSAVLAAAQAPSLFADRRLIEIRVPSGKPGIAGAQALQRYFAAPAPDVLTLVQLPRLDRQQLGSGWFGAIEAAGITVRVEGIPRGQLPAWLASRLAARGLRVAAGDEGERTLAFLADRVEGHLLAAQQEIDKLALLEPAGEIGFTAMQAAVLDVARYDVQRLGEAVLAGDWRRALRMLDRLRAEGESPVYVHWTLAEDARSLRRAQQALAGGRPLPLALREARVWGSKERLFERLLPTMRTADLDRWIEAAQACDGLLKGLKRPDWPSEPWDGLKRLVLTMLERPRTGTQPVALRA